MATEGILRIPRELPSDARSWEQFTRRLNKAIQVSGEQAVLSTLTTIAERSGTDLNSMLQLLSDEGRGTTQRLMPLINWANVGSVQSAIPLAASADATSATITIDAHDVLYGGETVSYNAGVVIGAPVSTPVHIFADDPETEGGAVTYEFTTDYTELAGALGRYRVGAIETPISSISAAVSAATNANPCQVTTGAAHGFSTGNVIDFASVGGMTQLNTGTYTITVVSPTVFTLDGIDATAFGVYTTGGTATRVSTPAAGLGGAGGGTEVYDPSFYYP